jgi:hypothetical protein
MKAICKSSAAPSALAFDLICFSKNHLKVKILYSVRIKWRITKRIMYAQSVRRLLPGNLVPYHIYASLVQLVSNLQASALIEK